MKRRDIRVDAVFDIETEDWTTFVCGALHTCDGATFVFDWKREEDFADLLLREKGHIWAHNFGGFDGKWLVDKMLDRGIYGEATIAGGKLVILRVKDGPTFFDSYALTRLSLEQFTEGMSVEKADTGLECICGQVCGGYCSITRGMAKAKLQRLIEYMVIDCKSLYCALEKLRVFAAENDIDLGPTVGSSAWRTAKRLLDLPPADLTPSEHAFIRKGCFGGRVQLFKPSLVPGHISSKHGWQYDVNSMYPSRLAYCCLPFGEHIETVGNQAQRSYHDSLPGFYQVWCEVPECYFPPLPYRTKNGVAYPIGRIHGVWSLPELESAEQNGVKITKVEKAIVWRAKRILFRELMDKLFDIRSRAQGGKKGPLGTFTKYVANSLTGKFASRPLKEKVEFNVEKVKGCTCEQRKHKGRIQYTECDGTCGAHTPLDEGGRIVTSLHYSLEACSHLEWYGYLTAEARAEWLREAKHAGERNVVYGDTDSLFVERELTREVGSKEQLGKWSLECEYKRGRFIAPKVYSYEVADKTTVKGKGIPFPKLINTRDDKLNADERTKKRWAISRAVTAIDRGIPVSDRGVLGFRAGAKTGNVFQSRKLTRTVNRGCGDRILEPNSLFSRPPTIEEIEDIEESDLIPEAS